MMQKITPFLWFNDNAEEAAHFYASIFEKGTTGQIVHYGKDGANAARMPEGSVMTITFSLCGLEFVVLNGGPIFTFTPAISFFVSCETEEQIDGLWKKLADKGNVRMELQQYPWSEKYGWLDDEYGVSWQLSLAKVKQKISPAFLFVGDNYGKANDAIDFYTSVFPDSKIDFVSRNGKDNPREKEGTIQYAAFTLCGQSFNAMEGNTGDKIPFSIANSFAVNCETQEEIDTYWSKLSAVKEAEQCGWLQDKFGVSWQIVPADLPELLKDPDRAERVMKAVLTMKKIDLATLEKAA